MPAPLLIDQSQLEAMIERAAQAGARAALDQIGLHDEDAAHDMRELRGLLDAWRDAKRTMLQTVLKTITSAALTALAIGALVKIWKD